MRIYLVVRCLELEIRSVSFAGSIVKAIDPIGR